MNLEEKRARLHAIIDEAAKQLTALECPFFIAAIDRDQRDPEGGKVFVMSEAQERDMETIFQHAFASNKGLVSLGLWLGKEIQRRNKDANVKFVKRKYKKNGKKD